MVSSNFKLEYVAPGPLVVQRGDPTMSRGAIPADLLYSKLDNFMQRDDMPDWRWDFAKEIADNISTVDSFKPKPYHDQIAVNMALPYLTSYNEKSNTFDGEEELAYTFPELYWAHKTYEPNLDKYYKQMMLECMIVADIPRPEIATRMRTTPDAIWAYEKIFFDVRDRLDSRDWMYEKIFRGSFGMVGTRQFEDGFWKMFSWKHMLGREGLKIVIEYGEDMSKAFSDKLNDIGRKRMAMNSLFAVFTQVPNRFNAEEILQSYHRLLELEDDKEKNAGNIQNQYNHLLSAISESFTLARHDDNLPVVEARAAEEYSAALMAVEASVVPPVME